MSYAFGRLCGRTWWGQTPLFEFPWKKVEGDLASAVQVREFQKAVREEVAKGHKDAPLLARRYLILGTQKTGKEQLPQFVRYSDSADSCDP